MASARRGAKERRPFVLGQMAIRDLHDAKREHEWQLARWRAGRHCRVGCDDVDEVELRVELDRAYHDLCAVVWTCIEGRGAWVPELAAILDVTPRTIERYKAEFRRGLVHS